MKLKLQYQSLINTVKNSLRKLVLGIHAPNATKNANLGMI